MNRRELLKGACIGAAATFIPSMLKAEQGCQQIAPLIRRCTAGISTGSLNQVQAFQEMPEWCWAASIEMVFAYYGHPVDQQRIVKETWGSVKNMPAQPQQILANLNREWTDDDGDDFTSHGDPYSVNANTAVTDLQQNHPLIIGALGHATVLTALTSDMNIQTGAWNVIAATVRDPWPGNGGERVLSPQEWYNINFGARIRVT